MHRGPGPAGVGRGDSYGGAGGSNQRPLSYYHEYMKSGSSVEALNDTIVLTPEDREKVRNNGEVDIGPFRLTINRDFVRTDVRADPDLPTVRYFFRAIEEVLRLHGRLYLLVVITPGVSVPQPEIRHYSAEWSRRYGADAIAIVAPGNPMYLMIVNLMFRALNALRAWPLPRSLFTVETEALAWLEEQRKAPRRPSVDLLS